MNSTPSLPGDEPWPPGREVPSPCNSICTLDAAGRQCVGCSRTLEEIAGWASYDADRRLAVWKLVRLRRRQAA